MIGEEESVASTFNPHVFRRLMGYLKPYILLTLFMLGALFAATTSEILLPVVVQGAVDNDLRASWLRIPAVQAQSPRLESLNLEEDGLVIGDYVYIGTAATNQIAAPARAELRDDGTLSREEYYLAPENSDLLQRIRQEGVTVTVMDGQMLLLRGDLGELPPSVLEDLRSDDYGRLLEAGRIFLGLLLAGIVFTFAQTLLSGWIGQRVMRDMRLQVFEHTVEQRQSFLDNNPVGRLVTRVTGDVETINEFFTDVMPNLLKDLAYMVGVVIALFALNPRMALITVATLPPVIILTAVFRSRSRNAYRHVRSQVSRMNGFLSEHFSGMSVVQSFSQEDAVLERFGENNQNLTQANLREMYVFAVFRPLVDLLGSTSIAIVIYFGARAFALQVVSLGILVAFINLVRRFYQPVMNISERFTLLQSAMAGAERVFALLDDVQRIPDQGKEEAPESVQGRIQFRDVQFSYIPGEPVLKGISFTADPGETVAIVGPTGAGKTTITSVLTRLWDIDSGSIFLDGVDIRNLPLAQLRTLIQPIQQDVFLFSDTIRQNILLGLQKPEEELQGLLERVQASGFVNRLPDGLDTHLSEGATNLSTGQRQLISFARILAHNPPVIVMDEATAHIDTETERLVQTGMEEVLKGRTSLVIAHRLSTIKNADRIIVLSHGQVAESGTHDSLLAERGLYYELYRLQYQEAT